LSRWTHDGGVTYRNQLDTVLQRMRGVRVTNPVGTSMPQLLGKSGVVVLDKRSGLNKKR
jgi:hypothetical protein